MGRQTQTPDSFVEMRFPLAGIDLSMGYERQPNRPIGDGSYARTTPVGQNVRAWDPVTQRARGAQRAGLAKYVATQVNGSGQLVQGLACISGVGYSAPGGGVQTSSSGRVVTLVAVANGTVKVADAGASAWTAVTNGTSCLNSSGIVLSAANIQKLWFADGTHWLYYDPSDNTMHTWAATAGSLPVDSAGNTPRLIATWRGRTVLSGLLKDPQNIFASRTSVPTDFDDGPVSPSADQSWALNSSTLGLVGDMVTGLVPLSDDKLLIGGDHTLWMLSGDPMAGGQLDQVSNAIGMAWGQAWCMDPYGSLYFVSNRMGIYRLSPGQAPVRISQQIEKLIQAVNTGTNTISLGWDDRWQGLHVFVTSTGAQAATTHYFYESRAGAWWTDVFALNAHNPLCCCTFDGNAPTDRVLLIGSWDGHVRYLSETATTDDGTNISSAVVIGPIRSDTLDDILLADLQAVLGTGSGTVTWGVYVGNSAEEALAATAAVTGSWLAGRNPNATVWRSGHALYLKITASTPWALETIRARIIPQGRTRARQRSVY